MILSVKARFRGKKYFEMKKKLFAKNARESYINKTDKKIQQYLTPIRSSFYIYLFMVGKDQLLTS